MSTHDIPRCSVETNVIRMLGDNPNTDNNLSAEQLKAKFDQAPEGIVAYLNNEMLPHTQGKIEIIGLLKSDGTGKVAEAVPGVDYQIPLSDKSILLSMLADEITAKLVNGLVTVQLPANGWVNKEQTVDVAGVKENNPIIVTASPESHVAFCEANVRATNQENGKITFSCEDVPIVDVEASVMIVG